MNLKINKTMKSLIISTVVIVGLIVPFMSLIERKIIRYDNNQGVQVEAPVHTIGKPFRAITSVPSPDSMTIVKPEAAVTTTKPESETTNIETIPVLEATLPAETKPVVETKPIVEVAASPVSESKPVEKNMPVEAKSMRTQTDRQTDRQVNLIAETTAVAVTKAERKPEGAPAPAAVPVVSPEDADELNKNAIKEALDYEQRKNDKTILEGQVVFINNCPDPGSIDYPDCNLTATVLINDLESTKIQLIIPCIRNNKIVISDSIRTNSYVAFKIVDEDSLSEEEKSIQLVDDDPDYELDYCYSGKIKTISSYSKTSRYTKKESVEIKYDTNLVLSEKDIVIRKDFINNEIKRLEKIISEYNLEEADKFYQEFSEFIEDLDNKHPYAELQNDNGLKKTFPVLFQPPARRFLDCAFSNDYKLMKHNAEVIASVNNYLKERGILLLVVPVPLPYESYAELFSFSKPLSTYNINRILFMKELLKCGVEVLDIEPMIKENITQNFYFFKMLMQDIHLTEIGAFYTAQYIYHHLNQYDYLKRLIKDDYSIELEHKHEQVVFRDELFGDINSISVAQNISPINKHSPFLLVGDSFSWYSHFQYYLSNNLRTKINTINAAGSYPITAQLIQMKSTKISSKTKVCILVDTAFSLSSTFRPLRKTGIQLYPSNFNQNLDLFWENKVLLDNDISFDLSLPETSIQSAKKILFSVYSNEPQVKYTIVVNQNQPVTFKTDVDGAAGIEYPLPTSPTYLHITLSASPDEQFKKSGNTVLEIRKIVLVDK